jgi:hypothetical protein
MGQGGNEPADDHTFFYRNGNENNFVTGFFIYRGIMSADKRVEFVGNRVLYIKLRGHKHDYGCSECACPK